jgi:hypothetical protein
MVEEASLGQLMVPIAHLSDTSISLLILELDLTSNMQLTLRLTSVRPKPPSLQFARDVIRKHDANNLFHSQCVCSMN